MKCWGWLRGGEGGTARETTTTPVEILAGGIIEIAASTNRSCAMNNAGGVKCWGSDGLMSTPPTTVDLPGPARPQSLALSPLRSCVMTNSGVVKCWTGVHTNMRDAAEFGAGVLEVAVGTKHLCALMSTGKVKCSGDNEWGQLGADSVSNPPTPVEVSNVP